MKFRIDTDSALDISDLELKQLLWKVYVNGGYANTTVAETLFNSDAVRTRGKIIAARDTQSAHLAGIVILVEANSPARRFATEGEAEMHLLAVAPHYRGHGLGKQLIESVIKLAESEGYAKMLLWTQTTMKTAQHLYLSAGFLRTPALDFTHNNRRFLRFEKSLNDSPNKTINDTPNNTSNNSD